MSGPWERYASAASSAEGPWTKYASAPPAQAPDANTGMREEFGNGLLLNVGDEAKAALKSAVPGVFNYFREAQQDLPDWLTGPKKAAVSQAPDFDARYTENLNSGRAQSKAFAAENPNLAAASNVAGNVVGTSALLAAGPSGLTSVGPSLIGNAVKMGAVSGALGGIAGFGEGEGGFDNRLGSAVLPATVGTVLGTAAPVVGKVAQSALESAPGRYLAENAIAPLARMLSGNPTRSLSAAAPDGGASGGGLFAPLAERTQNVAQTGAADRLATALQRGKIDPTQIEGRLSELGDLGTLADTDRQIASMVRSAHTASPTVQAHAKNVLEGRNNQLPGIIRGAFEGESPPPRTYELMGEGKAFDANARAVGGEAYGAMAGNKLRVSGEMQKLMADAPALRSTIEQIQADAVENGVKLSPIELMDRVKRQLNSNADAAFASGRAVNKADVGSLADRFEAAFWKANPSAQEAAGAYREAKALPESFQAGYNFLKGGTNEGGMNASLPALADALLGASPRQTIATRVGSTNAVRDLTLGRNPVSQARGIARDLPTEGIAPKVQELYGPDQARNIQRAGDQVRTFTDTSNYIRGGSNTTDKALEVVDDMANVGIRGGPQGVTARMWQSVEALANKLLGPNESVRQAIGRAGLNTDSAENRRMLALAVELLKKRQAGSPIRGGLIEGTSSQAGGQ